MHHRSWWVGSDTISLSSHHVDERHGFPCERGCANLGFQSSRDRERHYGTQAHRAQAHSVSQPRWTCGCGKVDHRRDKHLVHLTSCTSNSVSYICGLCGRSEPLDKRRHYQHVVDCKKRRGRKPKDRTLWFRLCHLIWCFERDIRQWVALLEFHFLIWRLGCVPPCE